MSTVIFDCDGTLVDSEPLARRVWAAELGRHGHTLTDDEYRAVLGWPHHATYAFFAERAELPPDAEVAPRIAEAMDALIAAELRPFPDAVETLDALRSAGVRLGLATSSRRARLESSLARVGLGDAFEVTVAGDEIEHGKPAPDIYLAVAAALGVAPEACVAVEDTGPGAASARAAGMRVVGVARSAADRDLLADADVVLDRLSAGDVLAVAG